MTATFSIAARAILYWARGRFGIVLCQKGQSDQDGVKKEPQPRESALLRCSACVTQSEPRALRSSSARCQIKEEALDKHLRNSKQQ
jgi:hypothetical protein